MRSHFVLAVSLPRASGAACGHHVSGVTTGTFQAFYVDDWVTWKMNEVVEAIRSGERFILQVPDSERTSELEVLVCPDCGRETVRSTSGGNPNDDLGAMPVM